MTGERIVARIMAAKGAETMLKSSEMTLKLAQNRVSFGLNGSHKARKFLRTKGPGFCPPPDISKANASKEFQPIMAARHRQNGRNCFVNKDFWNRTFSKNIMSWTDFSKYNRSLTRPGAGGQPIAWPGSGS